MPDNAGSANSDEEDPSDPKDWSTAGRLRPRNSQSLYESAEEDDDDDMEADSLKTQKSSARSKQSNVKRSARNPSTGKQSTLSKHFKAAQSRDRTPKVEPSRSRSVSRMRNSPNTSSASAPVAGPSNRIRGGTARPTARESARPSAARIEAAALVKPRTAITLTNSFERRFVYIPRSQEEIVEADHARECVLVLSCVCVLTVLQTDGLLACGCKASRRRLLSW